MPACPHNTNDVRCVRNAGFTLVEVMVTVAIAAMLMGGALTAVRSMRAATKHQAAVDAARTYAHAIGKFTQDHGGRTPVAGSNDWPLASVGGASKSLAAGPVDIGSGGRRYIDAVPETVSDGATALEADSVPQDTSAKMRVLYRRSGATTWALDVQALHYRDDVEQWKTICSLQSTDDEGVAAC